MTFIGRFFRGGSGEPGRIVGGKLARIVSVKGGGMIELIGIFVGHVYYFLKFRYAQDFGGPDILKTPQWLTEYFPNQRPGVSGFGNAPSRAQPSAPPQNRGSFFGRGRRLGD